MKTYVLHLLVILALAFGLSAPVVADKGDAAFKLEGAWIAKAQDPYFGQWSYVVSSDPSGKRGSGHGSVDVGFRANYVCALNGYETDFEPSDSESPILVSMVMTGPDTISYSAIWYGLKDLGPAPISNDIVLIGTVTGTLEVVAPGKLYGTHKFALYKPDADFDPYDGLPDETAYPECKFEMNTVDTRLPMPE